MVPLLLLVTALAIVQDNDAARSAEPLGDDGGDALDDTYAGRHALVIGIDKYEDASFRDLNYAVADALGVRDVLVTRYRFPEANVRVILNENATKQALEDALDDWACDPKRIGENDLFVLFFAGHGRTRYSPNQGSFGYLVPVDARAGDESSSWNTLLPMSRLQEASKFIPAKHAVMILDCCFGGLLASRGAGLLAPGLTRRARQVMTAGTAEQEVQDGGGGGHSVFTAALLDGLKGEGDDGDDIITFTELYNYVARRVEAETARRQTPITANFPFPDHAQGQAAFFAPDVVPPKSTPAERLRQLALSVEEQKAEIERLSDLKGVQDLLEEERGLWPRRAQKLPEMRGWPGRAKDILSRLPLHEASLARVQEQALASQLMTGIGKSEPEVKLDEARLDPLIRLRRDLHMELVASLQALQRLVASVEERLEIAAVIEERTVQEHAKEWAEASDEIAVHPLYNGLELAPVIGLIPLEPDPASDLWEFWVWETGQRPLRNEKTERWTVTGDTGMVLVLLPGGTFTMGASTELGARSYDPEAEVEDGPAHNVTLAPFFLSKYEMTQGQWQRITGANPSHYNPVAGFNKYNPISLAHPVESVSWEDCVAALARIELMLPTEAQWEFAARAGTDTPWWTGSQKEALEKVANLADLQCKHLGGERHWVYETWSDWYIVHAPVGSFQANRFGLHDIYGNVWEWCLDSYQLYKESVARAGDGLRIGPDKGNANKCYRGSSYYNTAVHARSASRGDAAPDFRNLDLGVRPCLNITGP
ncbi:MAG: SUMF1/EgtB/PvdO family nonheme iron enzyme [Planctomycetota bacterium]